jgi:phage gpG-like protein
MIQFDINTGEFINELELISKRSVTPDRKFFQDVGALMINSVLTNFEEGGRPHWQPPKSGKFPLRGSGVLSSTYFLEFGVDFVVLHWGDGLRYADIQNDGGTIQHPGSDKMQAFIGRNGRLVVTNHTRPHEITIPPRPYAVFQMDDVEEINNMWDNYLVNG